jgi:hypothetical protein
MEELNETLNENIYEKEIQIETLKVEFGNIQDNVNTMDKNF